MGLLTALDFHKSSHFDDKEKYEEVEYRLYSWGEIFPPFLGDREHSIVARWILNDFPFKLFSSSTPHDDPLPQKLCLTFRAPWEERKKSKSIGFFSEEIAKEFAAFISLVTRRRVFSGNLTRCNNLPVEKEIQLYQRTHSQERQCIKEIDPAKIYRLLNNLQTMDRMDRNIATGVVLAMRLYHSAVEIMYAEPEFSYLFLVASLETISSVVHKDFKPDNEEEFLDSRFSGCKTLLNGLLDESKAKLKNLLLSNEKFTFQKVLKFVTENVPDLFWSEKQDDAKPYYYTQVFGLGVNGTANVSFLPPDLSIKKYEKIEIESLKNVLRNVYKARSRLIHEGIRLPASIVVGLFKQLPPEAFITSIREEKQTTQQVPPLLTFERLVSYTIVEFLNKQLGV